MSSGPVKGDAVDDPWKYVRIADGIRSRIREGRLGARDLVSIKYLSQEHDVARQTAAKALVLLAREGLLQRFPGIGYIVTRDAGRERLPLRLQAGSPGAGCSVALRGHPAASLSSEPSKSRGNSPRPHRGLAGAALVLAQFERKYLCRE